MSFNIEIHPGIVIAILIAIIAIYSIKKYAEFSKRHLDTKAQQGQHI